MYPAELAVQMPWLRQGLESHELQVDPVSPEGQIQTKDGTTVDAPLAHEPPNSHGFGMHGSGTKRRQKYLATVSKWYFK